MPMEIGSGDVYGSRQSCLNHLVLASLRVVSRMDPSRRAAVVGDPTGMEELSGFQLIIFCLQLPFLLLVGVAKDLLQFLD